MKLVAVFFVYTCFLLTTIVRPTLYEMDVLPANLSYCKDNVTLKFSPNDERSIGYHFIASPLITCLVLAESNIHSVHSDAFELVPNLRYLDLRKNYISLSDLEFIHNHSKVEVLNLSGQQVAGCCIKLRLTGYYPKLQYLNLSSNYIVTISTADDFNYWTVETQQLSTLFPNLQYLDLSNNYIERNSVVNALPKTLTHLYLHRNAMSALIIRNLGNLSVLVVDDNQLHSTADGGWPTFDISSLRKLKYLSVAGNMFGSIYENMFSDLDMLEFLDMSRNKLQYIEMSAFDRLKNLRTLILDNNYLRSIPVTGSKLNLIALSINDNMLDDLTSQSFACCPYLKKLSLSRNRLNDIGINSDVFGRLSELEELSLADNRLSSLPDNWCNNLKKLRYLDFSSNKVNTIESLSLTRKHSLQLLDLRNNSLKLLHVRMFKNLSKNLSINVEAVSKDIEKTTSGN